MQSFFRILAFLTLLFAHNTYAQRNILRLSGKVMDGKEKLSDVKIILQSEGENIEVWNTSNNGKFTYQLPLQKNYFLIFSKPGYRSKFIEIKAQHIPPSDASFGYEFGGIHLSLFKRLENLEDQVLDKAIAQIVYDTSMYRFRYDAAYFEQVQEKIDDLNNTLDSLDQNKTLLALQEKALQQETLEKNNLEKGKLPAYLLQKNPSPPPFTEQENRLQQSNNTYTDNNATISPELLPKNKEDSIFSIQKPDDLKPPIHANIPENTKANNRPDIEIKEKSEKSEKLALADQAKKSKEDSIAEYNKKKEAYLLAIENSKTVNAKYSKPTGILNQEDKPAAPQPKTNSHEKTTRNIYRKGNKTITEYQTPKGDVYRKVIADWGGMYYFENEISITALEFDSKTKPLQYIDVHEK